MKTLYVLRHAKSSWDDNNLKDFDRPLNHRGEKTAPFIGEVMSRNSFAPGTIVSSPAARAQSTAELVKKGGGLAAQIRFDIRIYEASPVTLRDVASEISDEFKSAMIVGHNPGMEGLILFLTGRIESMPTAALAVIDLDIAGWEDIDARTGTLRTVIRPKDEMKMLGKVG